jgi:hypothetical protein
MKSWRSHTVTMFDGGVFVPTWFKTELFFVTYKKYDVWKEMVFKIVLN